MLSETTVRAVERRCARILEDMELRKKMTEVELARVWGAHTVAQWVLGGCTWDAGEAVMPDVLLMACKHMKAKP